MALFPGTPTIGEMGGLFVASRINLPARRGVNSILKLNPGQFTR